MDLDYQNLDAGLFKKFLSAKRGTWSFVGRRSIC